MSGSQAERLLDRDDLTRAFAALGKRLAERGVRAHMYVVGGAAMTMAYRRSRTTVDVDALTIDHRAAVLEAAGEVARELHLSADWLNENVRTEAKVPVVPDERAQLLYDSPHLVVTGASPAHMLAMKVHAARGADEGDIKWLMNRVGVRTMAGLEDVHREVFPEGTIPTRRYPRLGKLLREAQEEDRLRWTRTGRSRADQGLTPER